MIVRPRMTDTGTRILDIRLHNFTKQVLPSYVSISKVRHDNQSAEKRRAVTRGFLAPGADMSDSRRLAGYCSHRRFLPQSTKGKTMTKRLFCMLALLCSTVVPLLGSPTGAIVQGSHYDSARQVVTFDLLNTSQKEVSAYSLLVRAIRPDGTVGVWEYGGDFLPFMSENAGNGALKPGGSIAVEVPLGPQQIQNVSATVDVLVYADGTADVLDDQMFATIIAKRRGAMLGLQKANELLASALADRNDPHPSITATRKIRELARQYELHPPSGAEFQAAGLLDAATNISNAPKSPTGRSDREDFYLQALIKKHQDRASIMLSHTQVTKAVQQ